MSDYDELIGILKELLVNRFSPKPSFIRGILGDGQGNVIVPKRPDKCYVRFNRSSSEYFEVFNRNVNPVNDWPVLIGELPWQPGLNQVVDTDWSAYEQRGWPDSGETNPHAPTHEWPDGSPGSDPLTVYMRAIAPLRTYISATGTTVFVNSLEYAAQNCSGMVWPGVPGLDLAPAISDTTTGTQREMGIYLQPASNTLGVVTGASTVYSSAIVPPRVTFPAGVIPSSGVRIYGGQSAILEADIRDARRLFASCVTGTTGVSPVSRDNVWAQPNKANIGIVEYDTINLALGAASEGDTIIAGPGIFNETINITGTCSLIGTDNRTIITNSSNPALEINASGTYLRDLRIISTSTAISNDAVKFNQSYGIFDNVRAINIDGGNNRIGFNVPTGTSTELIDCYAEVTGAPGTNTALNCRGIVTVRDGKYDGDDFDVRTTITGSVATLYNPILVNSTIGRTGIVQGWYYNNDGDFRTAGGDLHQAIRVLNTSGATRSPGDVGYIDDAGEFKTTTTEADDVAWTVVLAGGLNNADIIVARRGRVIVNYTGTAPSAGDFLITSTTAGSAKQQVLMRAEIFAVCIAGGAGGQVEALLMTQSRTVPLAPAYNFYIQSTFHSGTQFTGTINGAPVGATFVYTLATGNENSIAPFSTNEIAKLRIYNSTRGNYALVDTVNTGTNTVTVTVAADIATWQNGDSITAQSQTNLGASGSNIFYELELENDTYVPALARQLFLSLNITDTGSPNILSYIHPWQTFSGAAAQFRYTQVANVGFPTLMAPIALIERKITFMSIASGSGTKRDHFQIPAIVVAEP